MPKLLAWWQLLRIGNVFTAASNVIAGFLIVQGGWQPVGPLLVLIAASALLYTAGMVLNDAFDAERDATERPERPIPSGRISRTMAFAAGWLLLVLGVTCAWWASWLADSANPCLIGVLLAATIVAYDAWLKSTSLGPLAMGCCRLLNVRLGVSMTADLRVTPQTVYAICVGLYAMGVTYFARSENVSERSRDHALGERLAGAAICVVILLPMLLPQAIHYQAQHYVHFLVWAVLLYLVFALVVRPTFNSHAEPSPAFFRSRVTWFLRGFILLDALVCLYAVGWLSGLAVLALLLPTWIASRFAPMT